MFGVPPGISGPHWPGPATSGGTSQRQLQGPYQHQQQQQHQQAPLHPFDVAATSQGAPGTNFLPPPPFFPGFNPSMPLPIGFNPFATGPMPFAVPPVPPWPTTNNVVKPPTTTASGPSQDANAKQNPVVPDLNGPESMDLDDKEEGELSGSEANIAHPPEPQQGKKSTSGLGIHLPQNQHHSQDRTPSTAFNRGPEKQSGKANNQLARRPSKAYSRPAPIVTQDEQEKQSPSLDRVALTQLKVQAQGALLSLHAHNIGYNEIVAEGIEENVLQHMYRGIGVTADAAPEKVPDKVDKAPESLPVKPVTTHREPIPDKPPSVARVPSTLPVKPAPPPVKEPTAKPVDDVTPKPPVTHPLPQKPHLPTPSTAGLPTTGGTSQQRPIDTSSPTVEPVGDKAKKPERKDIIAQMLAKKTTKTPQAVVKEAPQPEKPKADTDLPASNEKISTAPQSSAQVIEDHEHVELPAESLNTSQNPPSEAKQKEISKAQTELAKKRIKALKQQRLSQKISDTDSEIMTPVNQPPPHLNAPELMGPTVSSNDRSSPFQPQHLLPHSTSVSPFTAQQGLKSNVQIPGLFMATSDKPDMPGQQLPTPNTPWYSTHPSLPRSAVNRHNATSLPDFTKKPDVSDIRVCELGSRVVIDLSDNESEYDGSATGGAANQKNVLGQRDLNRPINSATPGAVSAPSGSGKEYLQSRIQELTEKIQALEKRKKLRQEQSMVDNRTEAQALPNTISEKQALEKVQDASKILPPPSAAQAKEISDSQPVVTESKENGAPVPPPSTAAPANIVSNVSPSNPVPNETPNDQSPTEQLSASLAEAAADLSEGEVVSIVSSRPASADAQEAMQDSESRREPAASSSSSSSSADGSDVMDIDDSVDESFSEPELTHPPSISHVVNDGVPEAMEAADDTIVPVKQVL